MIRFIFISLQVFFFFRVFGYSEYFLDKKYCNLALKPGVTIMGKKTIETTEDMFSVISVSSKTPIQNGDTFHEGGYYKLSYHGKGQHVFEIKGSTFSEKNDKNLRFTDSTFFEKNCYSTRSTSTTTYVALPIGDDLSDIEIICGYSSYNGQVQITKPFLLKAPVKTK